ncbi:unnamed protein product, partial [Heligmosomoides polygyrus]
VPDGPRSTCCTTTRAPTWRRRPSRSWRRSKIHQLRQPQIRHRGLLRVAAPGVLGEGHRRPYKVEISRRKQMFDFAISFSSIEHSGLGRYGDPVDPIGDLREVMKTMCILKKHGLFFLGLPRNQDGIHYNTHRFYGRIRLAMVMTGFEWLNTFEARSSLPLRYKREDFNYRTDFTHDLFVLRKL